MSRRLQVGGATKSYDAHKRQSRGLDPHHRCRLSARMSKLVREPIRATRKAAEVTAKRTAHVPDGELMDPHEAWTSRIIFCHRHVTRAGWFTSHCTNWPELFVVTSGKSDECQWSSLSESTSVYGFSCAGHEVLPKVV